MLHLLHSYNYFFSLGNAFCGNLEYAMFNCMKMEKTETHSQWRMQFEGCQFWKFAAHPGKWLTNLGDPVKNSQTALPRLPVDMLLRPANLKSLVLTWHGDSSQLDLRGLNWSISLQPPPLPAPTAIYKTAAKDLRHKIPTQHSQGVIPPLNHLLFKALNIAYRWPIWASRIQK